MDNLEWARGYTERFGIHWTNYTDENRAVYRKASGDWYAQVAATNCVPGAEFDFDKCEAESNVQPTEEPATEEPPTVEPPTEEPPTDEDGSSKLLASSLMLVLLSLL